MFKSIRNFDVTEKRVLVRCDFNVPLDNNGNILNDFRIKQTLPTIKYLIENKAKTILMSHLDDSDIGSNASIDLIKGRIENLIGFGIKKANDCIGPEVENNSLILKNGEILLLENVRIHKEEIENDIEFAKKLSKLAEIYINDAFSVCHRSHASIVSVPKYLPHGAGFLLQKEITILNRIMQNPEKPMIVIIGGKKVETKIKAINKISKMADFVIISGLIKKEAVEKKIKFDFPKKIIGPEDSLDALDINEKAVELFREKIKNAKTILWSGPFGRFEDDNYKKGTLEIAKAIIKSGAYSVVGGGETIEFLNKEGMIDKFSHISTGGGAMLSYFAGDILPGLKALE